MATKDPRIDAYIAHSAPFAQPILKHLRKVVHAGCPGVQETLKWSMPHFDYKGMMCGMAAFKAHCSFGFWKAEILFGHDKREEQEAMGHFGKITSLADLPPEQELIGYVRKAAALNEAGIKNPRSPKANAKREPLDIPDFFAEALRSNRKAREHFERFSYSHRKEYVDWLAEAKRDSTREQRLATTLEWLAAGKPRNWKYQQPR